MLLGRRPSQGTVPPHGRALRIASLLALVSIPFEEIRTCKLIPRLRDQTFATLHAISGVVLYILLEKQDSFVTFWYGHFKLPCLGHHYAKVVIR